MNVNLNMIRFDIPEYKMNKHYQLSLLEEGTLESLNELYLSMLPLLLSKYKNYRNILPIEDYYSEAYFSFRKCCDKFDASKGYQFTTFFNACLHRHLLHIHRTKLSANKSQSMLTSLGDDKVISWLDSIGCEFNFSDSDIAKDIITELNKYLDHIKPAKKDIFLLTMTGLNYRQVGEKLGYSRSYVHKVVEGMRSDLKRKFKRYELI